MATDEFLPQCSLTPDMIWAFRRKVLGGKSAVNGNPLPERLDECNVGVQEDHYAQACYFMAAYYLSKLRDRLSGSDIESVPVPSKIAPEHASELRNMAIAQALIDHGAG